MVNNKEDNLVSIIMPAYNAQRFIGETIQSVLNQKHQAFEIIIVNDGSTDDTEKVVGEFLYDKRVKYFRQGNQGCSGAKNTGLVNATGKFIQFLDADDLLSRDKIEEQVIALNNNPDAVAICRTNVFSHSIDDNGDVEIDTEFLYNTDNTLEFVLNLYGVNGKKGMIQPNAFLITRELAARIGPYDISTSPSPDEDGEYFCRAILAARKILFTENGVNYYRKPFNSKLSLSKQVSHIHARGALKSLILIKEHLLTRENSERVKGVMADYFANFIYLYSRYRDLVKVAVSQIHELGFKKIPPAGGDNFRKVSKLVGFHNALLFKNIAFYLKHI